jgi:hypothetical protein
MTNNSKCPSRLNGRLHRSCNAKKTEIKFWRWRLSYQEMQTRLWWGLVESASGESLESDGRFLCLCVWHESGLQSPRGCFHKWLTFWEILQALYATFNEICKDNAAIISTAPRYKQVRSRQFWGVKCYANNEIVTSTLHYCIFVWSSFFFTRKFKFSDLLLFIVTPKKLYWNTFYISRIKFHYTYTVCDEWNEWREEGRMQTTSASLHHCA